MSRITFCVGCGLNRSVQVVDTGNIIHDETVNRIEVISDLKWKSA